MQGGDQFCLGGQLTGIGHVGRFSAVAYFEQPVSAAGRFDGALGDDIAVRFDLAFELGPVEGLTGDEVKNYIRYIADRRLTQLGLNPMYGVEKNPLRWMDEMLNGVEHTNFFENRATEYSKASTEGTWDEAFD